MQFRRYWDRWNCFTKILNGTKFEPSQRCEQQEVIKQTAHNPTRRGTVGHSTPPVFSGPGDVFDVESSGGGGYGPPARRSEAARASDVANGFVSPRRRRR